MGTPPDTAEIPIAEEGRNVNAQRLLLIAGGGVVLLVLVWFFLLRGGPEEPALEVPAPPVTSPEPAEEEEPKERKEGPVETFEVFAPRDPFKPTVSAAAGAPAAVTGEVAAPGGTGVTTDGASGSIGGHRVRLVDVFPGGNRAQIQVDGTVYTVDEGERFADNFRLVSAQGQCATLLFGDDEFTLCEGEEVLK